LAEDPFENIQAPVNAFFHIPEDCIVSDGPNAPAHYDNHLHEERNV
jgi:hypothetical protein